MYKVYKVYSLMVPSSSKAIFNSEFPDGDSNQYDWRQSIKYNGKLNSSIL